MGFAIHQHESATGVYVYLVLSAPHLPPYSIPLGCPRAPALGALCSFSILSFIQGKIKGSKDIRLYVVKMLLGLPWWLTWYRICLQCIRPRFNPQIRKIPRGRKWQPTQYSCLENSTDRGAWQATVHGVAKSWTRQSD